MTYQEIKNFINTYIVQNSVNAITGAQLNTALNALADYYGFDSVVVTTLPAGSDATVNVQGRTLELGIPKGVDGVDGRDGRDGLDATNPFKGWFNSLADLKASYTASVGDSAYVKDASPATTWSIYIYDSTASSDNYWGDSGIDADTSNVQTFASGEEVNETYIDDTHLGNPAEGALPKAEDVMQLKAKLEGVTASEVKATIGDIISGFINQEGEPKPTGGSAKYVVIPLNNAKYVRLLGLTGSGTGINYSGYAFWKSPTYVDSDTVVSSYNWDVDTPAHSKEYVLKVPYGATHVAVTLYQSIQTNFYVYLLYGESVKDFDDEKSINDFDNGDLDIKNVVCVVEKGYVSNQGSLNQSVTSLIATVAINGEHRAAFLGPYNSSSGDAGYAFYDSSMNLIKAYGYPVGDISLSQRIVADIPDNASFLKFTVSENIRNAYYCYLIKGNSLPEKSANSIGDINYDEILAVPSLVQENHAVRGTTGEIVDGATNVNLSTFEIPENATYVRFLGVERSGTDITPGYYFYKVENIEGVDTEIAIGGNTFKQGVSSTNILKEYVVEIPEGATIFRTNSKISVLQQSDFYCYFGFGKNIKNYVDSIEHTTLIPINVSMSVFAEYMNRKSANIGMTNSEWHNPYGGRLYGFNYTTVKDLLYMTVFAASNSTLMRFMGCETVKVEIYGKNAGTRIVTNPINEQLRTQYSNMHSGETCPYRLIANKAGAHANEDGSGVVSIKNGFALVLVAEIEGKLVAAVTGIGNTSLGYSQGRLRRVKGMVELLDICAASIRGESITGMSVTYCEKAIACILPAYPSTCANYELPLIYQQDANTVFMPASVSKVMAAIAMIDILPLNDYHEILGNPDELVNDSDYTAYAGDIQTVEDSMYAMMMASNGANTLSLARLAGEHLIHNKNIILSNQ